MPDRFLSLLEAAKTLVTYIDTKYVFDKAAAGGCSGMDYYLSDKFYDLIVNTRKAIDEIENGSQAPPTNIKKIQTSEEYLRLFEAAKALATHVEKEHAFDKVKDMGSVGIETYQSKAFIEVIQTANNAIQEVESGLKPSELHA